MSEQTPPPVLWRPSSEFKSRARLTHYAQWLSYRTGESFPTYERLWAWSVEHLEAFWKSIWDYFEVQSPSPYAAVLRGGPMPEYEWFPGSRVNYAEHIFRMADAERPALLFQSERYALRSMSWQELEEEVAALATFLRRQGVTAGDRVVAYLPNIPEATVGFLAAASLGAVWSSCSPDFGAASVLDRFRQIEPKVLLTVDGYQYSGKAFDKRAVVRELIEQLPTLERVLFIPYLDEEATPDDLPKTILWAEALNTDPEPLRFEPVPFAHPLYVLYSSGTTGIPKAITHCHGGMLLEHLKYLAFHNDVHPGERFFWYSTTGWMMWNFVQASLLAGATIVLYDGSPGYPDLNVLWELAQKAGIHHFGTSAPYLVACMKQGIRPGKDFDLGALRSIGSTGAPLPPQAFDWVYEAVKQDLWLCSMSGGTDVCTAFVGGCPWEPVYEGEIQCRALGCSLHAFNDRGEPVLDQVGEMVITRPMPCMPVYFWNDPGKQRYRASYFEMYPGVWRHGDWVKVTSRGTLVIYGRSDATLNRKGVRIGTAEIYNALDKVPEVKDALVLNLELEGGEDYMPLFVVPAEGVALDEALKDKIRRTLRSEYSPRHVPDDIIQIDEVPYTISGKKLEAPVKKILLGIPVEKAANPDSMRNPQALDFFLRFRERLPKHPRKGSTPHP